MMLVLDQSLKNQSFPASKLGMADRTKKRPTPGINEDYKCFESAVLQTKPSDMVGHLMHSEQEWLS